MALPAAAYDLVPPGLLVEPSRWGFRWVDAPVGSSPDDAQWLRRRRRRGRRVLLDEAFPDASFRPGSPRVTALGRHPRRRRPAGRVRRRHHRDARRRVRRRHHRPPRAAWPGPRPAGHRLDARPARRARGRSPRCGTTAATSPPPTSTTRWACGRCRWCRLRRVEVLPRHRRVGVGARARGRRPRATASSPSAKSTSYALGSSSARPSSGAAYTLTSYADSARR